MARSSVRVSPPFISATFQPQTLAGPYARTAEVGTCASYSSRITGIAPTCWHSSSAGRGTTCSPSAPPARRCGRAANRPSTLLISDIGLPDFDGWELLARLRAHCAVPAIALTAFNSDEDRERSRAAGFDAHLPKPVDFKTLTAVVARYGAPSA